MADLITLEEYKLVKGMAKTDNDAKLSYLISTASSLIQTYIGRDLTNTNALETEVFDRDYGSPILFLDKYPITEIVEITELNPVGYDSTIHFPLPQSDYYVDYQNGKIIKTNGYNWSTGPGAIVVKYKSGTNTVGDTTGVPLELKQATIDLVTYYDKEEYKPSMQTRGATITNQVSQGRNGTLDTSFPPHIQRVLDLYK